MPKAPEPSSTCQKATKSLPRISPKSYCYNAVPNRFLAHFSTSRTTGLRSLSQAKASTHSAFGEGSHTTAYTAKHGAFRMGALLLPSERSTRFGNPAWPGFKTANFAAFGSWSKTLLKNAESLRSSDALMRVAVPRRRGPAGPRELFASAEVAACTPCAQCFPNVRDEGWYHYPQCALRAAETPDGRLSKRLICRFLRSGGRSSPHDSYFLANTQNFLLAVPVANAFALWYDKFSKLEVVKQRSLFHFVEFLHTAESHL